MLLCPATPAHAPRRDGEAVADENRHGDAEEPNNVAISPEDGSGAWRSPWLSWQ